MQITSADSASCHFDNDVSGVDDTRLGHFHWLRLSAKEYFEMVLGLLLTHFDCVLSLPRSGLNSLPSLLTELIVIVRYIGGNGGIFTMTNPLFGEGCCLCEGHSWSD